MRQRAGWAKTLLAGVVFLAACVPPELQATETPLPIPTATAELAPTETIVWFPPTPTRTPFPTREIVPTPDRRPGIGALILEDDFSQAGDDALWQTRRIEGGSTAYGNNQFTIAISEPKISMLSLRSEPALDDFYLEMTLSPSLCRGEDAYGIVFRATDELNFYRLLTNCNGQMRLEKANSGALGIVHDWTASGQIPPGSPLVLKVGVWAHGDDLRIFVNDVYQFGETDTLRGSGRVGVFARSAGQTPLTVSFDNLEIYELTGEIPAEPTPTPTGEATASAKT
jgi:hypothetical protein